MALGVLGKYERLDILGHGASGIVYLAQDTLLKRRVALKEIDAQGEEKKRVLDEARVLDRLRHPNIVSVHSVDTINGKVVIDMEYVQGSNLLEILRVNDGPLPLEDCLHIAIQICDGLAYAHAQRTIHRDIKPANILVSDQQQVKLADFGLAQVLGTNSFAGGAGTYAYMAPEDFEEGNQSDRQSDIWAGGVVLYEMLTGRRPFQASNPRDPFSWSRAIAKDVVEPPSFYQTGIPAEIDAVCLKALQRNKSDRYLDASEMATDLRAVGSEKDRVEIQAISHSYSTLEEPSETVDISPLLLSWVDVDGLLANGVSHWDELRELLTDGSLRIWLEQIHEPLLAALASDLSTGPDDSLDARLREFLYRAGCELESTARIKAREGSDLIAKRKHVEAVDVLQQAVHLDPARPSYYRLLAQAARGASDIDLARETLLQGMLRHPNNRQLKQDLAAIGGAPPELSAESIDFGAVHHGEVRTSNVIVRPVGNDAVKGRIAAAPVWLTVTPLTFNSRSRQVIKLEADSASLPPDGNEYVEKIVIETSGGFLELPVMLTVLPVRPGFKSIFQWYLVVLIFCLLPTVIGFFATLYSHNNGHEFLLIPAGLISSGILFVSFLVVNANADLRLIERAVSAVGIALLPLGAFEIGDSSSHVAAIFQRAVPATIITALCSSVVPALQLFTFFRAKDQFVRWPLWCGAIGVVSLLVTAVLWLSPSR